MQQLRPAGLAPGQKPASCAPPMLLVANKSDLSRRRGNGASKPLNPAAAVPEAWRDAVSAVVQTSARTGAGLAALKHAVLTLTNSPQLSSGAPQPCTYLDCISWVVIAKSALLDALKQAVVTMADSPQLSSGALFMIFKLKVLTLTDSPQPPSGVSVHLINPICARCHC